MASKWLSSPLARLAFLTGGTVLLTLGISQNENEWLWIAYSGAYPFTFR